jgi:hypothetical protein
MDRWGRRTGILVVSAVLAAPSAALACDVGLPGEMTRAVERRAGGGSPAERVTEVDPGAAGAVARAGVDPSTAVAQPRVTGAAGTVSRLSGILGQLGIGLLDTDVAQGAAALRESAVDQNRATEGTRGGRLNRTRLREAYESIDNPNGTPPAQQQRRAN